MKKIIIAVFLVMMMATPSFALFINGGFETGDASGWTFYTGGIGEVSTDITWGTESVTMLTARSAVINNDTPLQKGQTLDVDVYDDTYMLRLSSYERGNAKKVTQTDYISAQDIADGALLQVNWGAMLADPLYHDDDEQPFFKITVTAGSDSYTFVANGDDASGWILAGTNYEAPLYYKSGTYEIDLSNYNIGTAVTVEMIVTGCSLGGHGSWAYLDGIEIVSTPPTQAPEPATMLLLGLGLMGLAGIRRKLNK